MLHHSLKSNTEELSALEQVQHGAARRARLFDDLQSRIKVLRRAHVQLCRNRPLLVAAGGGQIRHDEVPLRHEHISHGRTEPLLRLRHSATR